MITFISCAKTMAREVSARIPSVNEPQYLHHAQVLTERLAAFSVEELMDILKVSPAIATENQLRYKSIVAGEAEMMPAIFAYTGMVFKHIDPYSLSTQELEYAHGHLRITSFLYGLLRPLDAISPYRLEGGVTLDRDTGKSMFNYWQPVLTDSFIDEINASGGTLVNLASGEMKSLFDWKKVESAVNVVHPEFLVQGKDGKTKTVTVYAKMCRGEMTRYIITNRISDPKGLKSFEWNGFGYDRERSDETKYVFIKQTK